MRIPLKRLQINCSLWKVKYFANYLVLDFHLWRNLLYFTQNLMLIHVIWLVQAAIVRDLYCFSLELDDFIRNLKIFNLIGILSLSHPFHSDLQIKTYHHSSSFPATDRRRPCSTTHSHLLQLKPPGTGSAAFSAAHIRRCHLHHYYSHNQSFSYLDWWYFYGTCLWDCFAFLPRSSFDKNFHCLIGVCGCLGRTVSRRNFQTRTLSWSSGCPRSHCCSSDAYFWRGLSTFR